MKSRDPKKRIDLRYTLATMFIMWGCLIAGISLPFLVNRLVFISSANSAVGRSVDVRSYVRYKNVFGEFIQQQVYVPVVEFTDTAGKKHRFISVTQFTEKPTNNTFPVYYQPTSPGVYLENKFSETLMFPLGFFLLGVLLIMRGCSVFSASLNRAYLLWRKPQKADFLVDPAKMFMVTKRGA